MLVRENLFEEFKYFKGKSDEDIEKSLKELSLKEKFEKGLNNKIKWLIDKCIEEGVLDYYQLEDKFVIAVKNNMPDIVQDCLSKGINPRVEYKGFRTSSIKYAIRNNFTDIVKILMKYFNLLEPSSYSNYENLVDFAIRLNKQDIINLFFKDYKVQHYIQRQYPALYEILKENI